MKYPIIKNLLAALAILFLVQACKKDDLDTNVRLFRPVLKGDLISEGNWIEVNWQPIKGAGSYTVQISKDTFRTVLRSVEVDSNFHEFKDLEWEKLYQLQIKANAKDTVYNSKWSSLGAIKTPKFPTILNTPGPGDITEDAIRVSWTNDHDPVTAVKVLLWSDSSLINEVPLTAGDIANANKIVTGLSAGTKYIVYLYSGTKVRGWVDVTTKEPFSGTIIDLRNITDPNILKDTLPDVPSGSIVYLKRGMTYVMDQQINLGRTIIIASGDDLTIDAQAIIASTSNFNFVAGAAVDSIVFRDLHIRGGADNSYGNHYLFNATNVANVGKLVLENCHVQILRGIFRIRNTNTVGLINISDCVIDSIAGYGVVAMENTATAMEINIHRSTIYKAEKVIASTTAANTVSVQYCTINEAPSGSNYYFDYNSAVVPSFKIYHCIFGTSKGGSATVRGFRGGSGTVFELTNTHNTSDFKATTNPIPGFTPYSKSSTDLWTNPAGGNFTIKDNTFPARNTAGDPRWRP